MTPIWVARRQRVNHSNIIIFKASGKYIYIYEAVTAPVSIDIVELNFGDTQFESRPNYLLNHLDFRNLLQRLVSKMALI